MRANALALEQILFNLVDNACKYAAAATDRTIHLSATSDDAAVFLRVRDHGPGIRAGAARIFHPFKKSVQEAANTAPGLGLGLALSRRLARSMGGDLRVDPAVTDGAGFILTLPRAAPECGASPRCLTRASRCPIRLPVQKTVVLNAVGLTPSLIGRAHAAAARLPRRGAVWPTSAPSSPPSPPPSSPPTSPASGPASTASSPTAGTSATSARSSSGGSRNKLVQAAEGLGRRPAARSRAVHLRQPVLVVRDVLVGGLHGHAAADVPGGRAKLPDVWTHPPELRDELQRKLGQFPLFKFWGPATGIKATRWIADAAMRRRRRRTTRR